MASCPAPTRRPGYYDGEEVLACERAGVTPLVPKPLTSGAKAEGRFGKQGFAYVAEDDEYRCPAGERLARPFDNVENGMTLGNYWASACPTCPIKAQCTTGRECRIKRREHEASMPRSAGLTGGRTPCGCAGPSCAACSPETWTRCC